MKTFMPKRGEIGKKWYVVDATDEVLGRLASRISLVLQGKHKPSYVPYLDTGDWVVVINAEKIKLTGKKLANKIYKTHSGYIGNLKEKTLGELMEKKPEDVIIKAVKRMLPKNKLASKMIKKLKVYAGPEHPHKSEKPEPLSFAK
jgi:large subunit ribosomal protein L13